MPEDAKTCSDADLLDHALMAARSDIALGDKPLPVGTVLLHAYCDNEPAKFKELCDLIRRVQEETIKAFSRVSSGALKGAALSKTTLDGAAVVILDYGDDHETANEMFDALTTIASQGEDE